MGGRVGGIVFAAVLVLATIWAYNHFTKDGVANLGKKAAA